MDSFELIVKEISENNNPDNLKYTHSEVIALIDCLEEISLSLEWENEQLINGLLKGLKKFGITHKKRAIIAKIMLGIFKKDKQDKKAKKETEELFGTENDF